MNTKSVIFYSALIAIVSVATVNAQEPDMGIDGSTLVQSNSDPRLSYDTTNALIDAATSGEGDSRVEATEALWRQAADLQFTDPASISALQQLAYDDNPRVRRIAEKALKDMEHYLAQ